MIAVGSGFLTGDWGGGAIRRRRRDFRPQIRDFGRIDNGLISIHSGQPDRQTVERTALRIYKVQRKRVVAEHGNARAFAWLARRRVPRTVSSG